MAKIALPFPIPREWGPSTAQAIEDNLQRMFSSSGRIGQGGTTFVNGLDAIVPVPGDMIVCTTAGLFIALALDTTAQRVLTNNGGTPTWALVSLSTGVTGDLPLANIVDASATQRVLGRNSGGSGVWEEVTLSQLLDWIGTAAQGDILYRDSSGWARLAAGTAGQILQTGGASANPSWATGGGGIANNIITQQYFEVHGRPTTLVPVGVGALTVSGTLATTQTNGSDGSRVNLIQTGTTAGLRAGFASSRFDLFETDSEPIFEFVLTTGATLTNLRIWIGICNADLNVNADDEGGTTQYMAFRYSSVVPDGGWVGVCRDGTTQSAATATVAAIAASTRYKLKIRKAGSSVFFSVNGGTEQSISSNLPAAGTGLGFAAHWYNSVNSTTHPWDFSRLRGYYGS